MNKRAYYKMQLVLPGQQRHEKGAYCIEGKEFPILAGYVPDRDVFILWDAYMHEGERYGHTLSIPEEPVIEALGEQVVAWQRHTRRGKELVLTAHGSNLQAAIRERWDLNLRQLL